MMITYPVLMFIALVNVRVPGVSLILVGAVMNFAVMAANGGLMPVSPEAVATSGGSRVGEIGLVEGPIPGTKSVVVQHGEAHAEVLADRFAVDLPWVGRKVASPGDILITAGLGATLPVQLRRMRSSRLAEVKPDD
jgi:hypothetical protein